MLCMSVCRGNKKRKFNRNSLGMERVFFEKIRMISDDTTPWIYTYGFEMLLASDLKCYPHVSPLSPQRVFFLFKTKQKSSFCVSSVGFPIKC